MGPEKSWTHRLLRTEQDPPVETDTRLKMCKPDTEHLSYSWSYLFSSDSVYIFSLVILSWRNVIYIYRFCTYIYLSIHYLLLIPFHSHLEKLEPIAAIYLWSIQSDRSNSIQKKSYQATTVCSVCVIRPWGERYGKC